MGVDQNWSTGLENAQGAQCQRAKSTPRFVKHVYGNIGGAQSARQFAVVHQDGSYFELAAAVQLRQQSPNLNFCACPSVPRGDVNDVRAWVRQEWTRWLH